VACVVNNVRPRSPSRPIFAIIIPLPRQLLRYPTTRIKENYQPSAYSSRTRCRHDSIIWRRIDRPISPSITYRTRRRVRLLQPQYIYCCRPPTFCLSPPSTLAAVTRQTSVSSAHQRRTDTTKTSHLADTSCAIALPLYPISVPRTASTAAATTLDAEATASVRLANPNLILLDVGNVALVLFSSTETETETETPPDETKLKLNIMTQ